MKTKEKPIIQIIPEDTYGTYSPCYDSSTICKNCGTLNIPRWSLTKGFKVDPCETCKESLKKLENICEE